MAISSENEPDLNTLEAVDCRLVRISSSDGSVTLKFEGDETTTETFPLSEDFDDDAFSNVRKLIGRQVQAVLNDGEVISISEI